MLNRYRLYSDYYPLQSWLLEIGVLAALNVVLGVVFYAFSHELLKPGIILLQAAFVLSSPTNRLMQRFSAQERLKNPVSPRQATMIARGSVVLALCSVCVLSLILFGRHFGFHNVGLGLLMVSSFFTLLSLALGYAVRYTPEGRWALRVCLGGLALMILTILISLLVKSIMAG